MKSTKCVLLLSMILCTTLYASAQDEHNTEIQGFYQTYRNFSFQTGASAIDIPETKLNGGGFNVAQNLAPWFAMWTQFTFFGSAEQPNMRIRLINNQQGFRFQTKQHGPFRFYGKGGLGFANYSVDILGSTGGETKLSLAYGAGVQIWMSEHFGVVLDASHVINGLPNITNLEGREKWDSGIAYTGSLAVRF